MGELTIKLEDAKLLEALTQMATVHQKPVEAEILGLLEKAVQEHARKLELLRRAREISAMTPKGVVQTNSVEIIREMREERMRDLGS